MSRPPINPDKTLAGIAVDPQTLERVIPESRRTDGTVRKQIKIRPGFTPQEDVRRFRGTKQAQMDTTALPKGHIIGWAPPPQSTASSSASGTKPLSKSAKKNAKRKEKREKDKPDVPDNWEDDEEDSKATSDAVGNAESSTKEQATSDKTASAREDATSELANKLDKLDVK